MTCVMALSTDQNTEVALSQVLERVARDLGGHTADLAVVFASSHYSEAFRSLAQAIRERGISRHVLGCSGESIIGEDKEVEAEPALSLWAIHLPGTKLSPRRITFDELGWKGCNIAEGKSDDPIGRMKTLILLGDPFSFPADQFLKHLNETCSGLKVVGGMASASQRAGKNRLLLDEDVFSDGAVGVEMEGTLITRTVVSQGCRPIGRSLIVTRAEGNVIRELGRRPALEVLREIFDSLVHEDQERVQQGLHLGRVINEYQESFQQGDFLIRNVLGSDEKGGIAVTDVIRVGQTVQFHVRDADTADADLRTLLENERDAYPESRLQGALLFSCNGRGTRLFNTPHHDVKLLQEVMGNIPVAGFFAMGELGPIGGKNFVHGFTASVLLFTQKHL
ncbi:MAG: FIST N-terminal domain-containing protein [Isosphaeraceae bacterium]